MDFFARQDQARRNTAILVFYFLLAVMLIVLAVNAVVYFFLAYFGNAQVSSMPSENLVDSSAWLYISLLTIGVIVSGSLFRLVALSGGGSSVARMVDARMLSPDTKDADERRYFNVVEEMSIASGVPVPVLYVMDDEPGINAFVAGYKPTEAVMVVTRGAMNALSRDELQGVVGHEFSHILNGDMRMNIRLLAVLAGILLIGRVGEIFMRGSGRSGRGKNQGMLLGLALFAVGYIGLFFGRLIKAAISRQREFLADASSVQFTRNPSGIAGALYKIGQTANGPLLMNGHAEDMSHMCFGETMRFSFRRLLATHPPIDERIDAVDPHYLNRLNARERIADTVSVSPGDASMGFAAETGIKTSANELAASVGSPSPQQLAYGRQLYESIGPLLLERLHTIDGAQALLFSLVLSGMDRQHGFDLLKTSIDKDIVVLIEQHMENMETLPRSLRLPVIDLAIATLKQSSPEARIRFLDVMERLVKLDDKYSLLEFVLLSILNRQLGENSQRVERIRYRTFKAVAGDIQLLLSLLAQCSGQSADKQRSAFEVSMKTFITPVLTMMAAKNVSVGKINHALQRLNQMPAVMKKSFLISCADLVIDDGIIMPSEAELLRAVAEALDCPMPPLLPQP